MIMKVKDVLEKENNVVVNGKESLMLIKNGNRISVPDKYDNDEYVEMIMEAEVLKTFIVKGVINDILRVTI